MSEGKSTAKPAVAVIGDGLSNMDINDLGTSTKAQLHLDRRNEPHSDPIVMPVYQSSTYRMQNVQEYKERIAKVSSVTTFRYKNLSADWNKGGGSCPPSLNFKRFFRNNLFLNVFENSTNMCNECV